MGMFDIPQPLPTIDPSWGKEFLKEQKKKGDDLPIVIVGAGVAGLSAAYTLEYLGISNYQILEANRVGGGRCHHIQLESSPVPLDVGAEWIHVDPSLADKTLQQLLLFPDDQQRLATDFLLIPFAPKTYSFYNFGALRPFNALAKSGYVETKFQDKTWSQFIQTFFYDRVKEHVELNTVVTKIEWNQNNDSTTVSIRKNKKEDGGGDDHEDTPESNNNKIQASHVICAVPLSILKKGDITFQPPFTPSQTKLLKRNSMPPAIKVGIVFSGERFYPDTFYDQSFLGQQWTYMTKAGSDKVFFDALHNKGLDSNNNSNKKDEKYHVMGVYVYGKHATEILQKCSNNDEILQYILNRLEMMFPGGEAKKQYREHYVQNWQDAPFIGGGFANPTFAKEMEQEFVNAGNIAFCGEHTAGSLAPTVHGAALSGRRAALQCLGHSYNFSSSGSGKKQT